MTYKSFIPVANDLIRSEAPMSEIQKMCLIKELEYYALPHFCKTNAPLYCLGCNDPHCQRGQIAKPKCYCGKDARWHYDPAGHINPYYCEDHVSRGCSCNDYLAEQGYVVRRWRPIKIRKLSQAQVDAMPCCEYSRVRPHKIANGKRKVARNKKKAAKLLSNCADVA